MQEMAIDANSAQFSPPLAPAALERTFRAPRAMCAGGFRMPGGITVAPPISQVTEDTLAAIAKAQTTGILESTGIYSYDLSSSSA